MWIVEELEKLDPDRTELRKFSLILGGAFLALGSFAWYRGSGAAPYLLVPGAGIALVGVVFPAAVRWLFFVWMALGLVLGTIVTGIILAVVFIVAVTPIGLIMRATGRDPLNRKLDPDAPTYWLPKERTHDERSRMEKYF